MSSKGVEAFTPLSTIQTRPPRSQTNIRPSAAKVRPMASFHVPPMDSSTNPAGSVAARVDTGCPTTWESTKTATSPLSHDRLRGRRLLRWRCSKVWSCIVVRDGLAIVLKQAQSWSFLCGGRTPELRAPLPGEKWNAAYNRKYGENASFFIGRTVQRVHPSTAPEFEKELRNSRKFSLSSFSILHQKQAGNRGHNQDAHRFNPLPGCR